MSVVVAVIDPGGGRVHLAADAAAVDGSGLVVEAEKLVVLLVGDRRVVVGWAGWAAWGPMVVDAVQEVELPADPRHLDAWARAVAVAATAAAVESKLIDGDGRLDSEGLLAVSGRVWELGHDGALPVRGGYQAIGSGAAVALGALHQLARLDTTDPASWPERAVEAAADHVVDVRGPVTATST